MKSRQNKKNWTVKIHAARLKKWCRKNKVFFLHEETPETEPIPFSRAFVEGYCQAAVLTRRLLEDARRRQKARRNRE
jgi:hypothetical protein